MFGDGIIDPVEKDDHTTKDPQTRARDVCLGQKVIHYNDNPAFASRILIM
jgi:hypothetical protein